MMYSEELIPGMPSFSTWGPKLVNTKYMDLSDVCLERRARSESLSWPRSPRYKTWCNLCQCGRNSTNKVAKDY